MFESKLKDLEKGKKKLLKLKKDITRRVNKKVSSTIKDVKKTYLEELEKIRNASKEEFISLDEDYKTKMVTYSSLNLDLIGKHIAEIMSLYEGRKYCYQKAGLVLPYYKDGIDVTIYCVVPEESKCDFYIDTGDKYILNTLNRLLENGIVFSTDTNSIDFYRIDANANIVPTINSDKFPYVQEFIDYIIEYKIEYEMKEELTKEKLEDLTWNFIYDKAEDITACFGGREKEALDYLEEVRRNNLRVDRELDKILKL